MKWKEEDKIRLVQLVLSGELTVTKISELLGRSPDAIRKQMRVQNLRVTDTQLEKKISVIEDFQNNKSITALSKAHNSTESEIKGILLWGREQGLLDYKVPVSSAWKSQDILALGRMATLLDDKKLISYLNRAVKSIDAEVQKLWKVKPKYLIGIEIEEFVEMFKLGPDDEFPIVTTCLIEDGKSWKVVPWCFAELFEARNPEIEDLVEKMGQRQRLMYMESDRKKVLQKIIDIIDGKYSAESYGEMQ